MKNAVNEALSQIYDDAMNYNRYSLERLTPSALSKAMIIFLILVCTSLIFATAWQIYESSVERLATAVVSASNITRAVEQQAQDTVKQASNILRDLAERVTHDGLAENQRTRLSELMEQHTAGAEELQGLFIYDDHGDWVANSFPENTKNKNNSDREYFIYNRQNNSSAIKISSIIKSRTTGDMVIPISRRINNLDGSFAGVALATIPVSYFNDFFNRMTVDEDGVIFLALDNGDLLARRPTLTTLMTTNISKGEIFSKYLLENDSGTATLKSVVDNIERVYAYRRLADLPIVAAAGISQKHIFAPWWSYLYRSCAITGLIIISLFILAKLLYHQIQHLIIAESKLTIAHNDLEVIALTDSLTSLANRRCFDNSFLKEWRRAIRSQSTLSVILLDIDWFKQYNDNYGHLQGDECLKIVSQEMARVVNRPGDLAARYGGEEFVVLLPETSLEGALNISEKIRSTIAGKSIDHFLSPLGRVTISAGVVAIIPTENDNHTTLLSEADRLLYSAKLSGRNKTNGEIIISKQKTTA